MKKYIVLIYIILWFVAPVWSQQFTTSVPVVVGGSLALPMQMARPTPGRVVSSGYSRTSVQGSNMNYGYSASRLGAGRKSQSGQAGNIGGTGCSPMSSSLAGKRSLDNVAFGAAQTTFDMEPAVEDIAKARPGGYPTGSVGTPLGDTPVFWMAILMVAYIAAKTASKRLKEEK